MESFFLVAFFFPPLYFFFGFRNVPSFTLLLLASTRRYDDPKLDSRGRRRQLKDATKAGMDYSNGGGVGGDLKTMSLVVIRGVSRPPHPLHTEADAFERRHPDLMQRAAAVSRATTASSSRGLGPMPPSSSAAVGPSSAFSHTAAGGGFKGGGTPPYPPGLGGGPMAQPVQLGGDDRACWLLLSEVPDMLSADEVREVLEASLPNKDPSATLLEVFPAGGGKSGDDDAQKKPLPLVLSSSSSSRPEAWQPGDYAAICSTEAAAVNLCKLMQRQPDPFFRVDRWPVLVEARSSSGGAAAATGGRFAALASKERQQQQFEARDSWDAEEEPPLPAMVNDKWANVFSKNKRDHHHHQEEGADAPEAEAAAAAAAPVNGGAAGGSLPLDGGLDGAPMGPRPPGLTGGAALAQGGVETQSSAEADGTVQGPVGGAAAAAGGKGAEAAQCHYLATEGDVGSGGEQVEFDQEGGVAEHWEDAAI